jgi:hypothetical protein
MCEYRHRPSDIEVLVLLRKPRALVYYERMERRAEVILEPRDARRVDIATPEVRGLRLFREVAEYPSGSAAEVEGSAASPVPPVGE